MRKFFRNVVWLALLVALGYLGWQTAELRRENRKLWETVTLLEKERGDLRQQLGANRRAPKPEEQADQRRQIEQQTSELRGLRFRQPVTYKMIERRQLREMLERKVREQYSEQEVRDYGRSLAALGLIPEGIDLMSVWLSLYDEQVGGFYVPEEHAMYTFNDLVLTGGLDKMLLSHELTHVLQDQQFDLTKLPLNIKDNDDLALASSALIEGDATVVMTRFYAENANPGSVLGDLTAMLRQNTTKLREAPPFLRDMLLFPYQQGQQFVNALMAAGGNESVDAAFRRPPTSTAEILHPDRFLARGEAAPAVTLPRISSKDWRLIGNNVLGEFGIQELLQASLGVVEAQLAAQGWTADRYQVYERGPKGPTGLVWRSSWNRESDAREFEEAYGLLARKRSLAARVHRQGTIVTIQQSSDPAFLELSAAALGFN